MKDLITTVASLLILMIFVMQFATAQGTHHQMLQADLAVASFRESLKAEGRVSMENRNALCRSLAEICGCRQENIVIEAEPDSGNPVPEGSLIYYQIGYPLKNLIAAASALGISDGQNQVYFQQEGWVVSSYEEPDYNDGDSAADDDGDSV